MIRTRALSGLKLGNSLEASQHLLGTRGIIVSSLAFDKNNHGVKKPSSSLKIHLPLGLFSTVLHLAELWLVQLIVSQPNVIKFSSKV